MAKGSVDFEVDGVRYTTSSYPATTGVKLLAKLTKVIAEPIGYFANQNPTAVVDTGMIGNALKALANNIDPDDLISLMDEILIGTQIKAGNTIREIIIDTDFSGNLDSLFEVVGHVLKFQFGNVFQKVAAKAALLTATQKAAPAAA